MPLSVQPITDSKALIQELEEYHRQFVAIMEEAKALLLNLTHEQFNWYSQPGSWSIAQCIDHLNVTGKIYNTTLDKKITEAHAQQLFSHGPFRQKWLDNLFIRSLEPPVKRKFKAPKQFVPQADKPLNIVSEEFMLLHEQFLKHLQNANGLNLTRIQIPSPVISLLKMTLLGVFGLITAHERRHLWQAQQVLQHPNFPR
jgi:hypothetical protein